MYIKFLVPGNPVPCLRITQGQLKLMRIPDNKLRPDGLRIKNRIRAYLAYKDRVYDCSLTQPIDRNPKEKVFLNVMIYFGSHRHGDPENIRKGIQDAIYKQDRLVAGSVDFGYDPPFPRVEIEIEQP
jgi:hypothetical protein